MASVTPLIGFVANMSPPYSISRPGTSTCVAQRLDLLAVVEERLVGAVGEVDLGVGDAGIVGPDLAGAFLGVRAHDRDVGDVVLDLGEEVLHRALHGGILDALVGPEDDLALDLAVAEARLLEQVEGGLALGAGQLELGVERASDHAREGEGADQSDDPGHEDATAASVHGAASRSSMVGGPHVRAVRERPG